MLYIYAIYMLQNSGARLNMYMYMLYIYAVYICYIYMLQNSGARLNALAIARGLVSSTNVFTTVFTTHT
jgi:hypothetical protein